MMKSNATILQSEIYAYVAAGGK